MINTYLYRYIYIRDYFLVSILFLYIDYFEMCNHAQNASNFSFSFFNKHTRTHKSWQLVCVCVCMWVLECIDYEMWQIIEKENRSMNIPWEWIRETEKHTYTMTSMIGRLFLRIDLNYCFGFSINFFFLSSAEFKCRSHIIFLQWIHRIRWFFMCIFQF